MVRRKLQRSHHLLKSLFGRLLGRWPGTEPYGSNFDYIRCEQEAMLIHRLRRLVQFEVTYVGCLTLGESRLVLDLIELGEQVLLEEIVLSNDHLSSRLSWWEFGGGRPLRYWSDVLLLFCHLPVLIELFDTGLALLLVHFSFKRRIKVVLYMIVSPPR